MRRRAIVANLWGRATAVSAVPAGAPDPSAGELAAIAARLTAANCGVRPSVRVVEQTTVRAFDAGGNWPDPCDDHTAPRGLPPRKR